MMPYGTKLEILALLDCIDLALAYIADGLTNSTDKCILMPS